ncbi:MAG: hypothetical protein P8I83_03775 [Paracoccaceae bacterium]|nr:hypothetical protein [Paracoccaceae bacterium]
MSDLINVSRTCHCGKISVSGTVEPDAVVAFHWTDCQVLSDGPSRNNVMLKSENISIKGEVSNCEKFAIIKFMTVSLILKVSEGVVINHAGPTEIHTGLNVILYFFNLEIPRSRAIAGIAYKNQCMNEFPSSIVP